MSLRRGRGIGRCLHRAHCACAWRSPLRRVRSGGTLAGPGGIAAAHSRTIALRGADCPFSSSPGGGLGPAGLPEGAASSWGGGARGAAAFRWRSEPSVRAAGRCDRSLLVSKVLRGGAPSEAAFPPFLGAGGGETRCRGLNAAPRAGAAASECCSGAAAAGARVRTPFRRLAAELPSAHRRLPRLRRARARRQLRRRCRFDVSDVPRTRRAPGESGAVAAHTALLRGKVRRERRPKSESPDKWLQAAEARAPRLLPLAAIVRRCTACTPRGPAQDQRTRSRAQRADGVEDKTRAGAALPHRRARRATKASNDDDAICAEAELSRPVAENRQLLSRAHRSGRASYFGSIGMTICAALVWSCGEMSGALGPDGHSLGVCSSLLGARSGSAFGRRARNRAPETKVIQSVLADDSAASG